MKSVGSLPTAGPPQWIGNDGDDAVARRHGPRGSPRNGQVIAQIVLEQLGVPAGGPAAAVGVVAVGQADGRAVAGDVPGIAFNAQAVTIAAQIVAAEASGRSVGGTGVSVAGRTPALRSARRAAAGVTDFTELAGGMPGGHDARPAPAVRGRAGAGHGRAGGEARASESEIGRLAVPHEPIAVSTCLGSDEPSKGDAMDTSSDAWMHFFKIGMQYYIAGRAAARGHLVPVAGNLLHHGVEMLLKGDLSKTFSLGEIKKNYGHRLVKTWNAFKDLHANEDLSGFDVLVANLDRFEKIRYPDDYINRGAIMAIGWGTLKPAVRQIKGPRVPEYCLYVNEVDALIARLFKVCRINPRAYWGALDREALRFLQYDNSEYEGWGLSPTLEQK